MDGCNAQTLRYYDKIDLLKPVKVDQWSGYRYYEKAQAVDFFKIKNLQAADFTIDEIKALPAEPEDIRLIVDGQIISGAEHIADMFAERSQTYTRTCMDDSAQDVEGGMDRDVLVAPCLLHDIIKEFGGINTWPYGVE